MATLIDDDPNPLEVDELVLDLRSATIDILSASCRSDLQFAPVFNFYPNFKDVLELVMEARLLNSSINQSIVISEQKFNDLTHRSLHSIAILRFINFVYENFREKLPKKSVSFHSDLKTIEIPEWLIDLRNFISHQGLPNISELEVANQYIYQFILDKCHIDSQSSQYHQIYDDPSFDQYSKYDFATLFEDKTTASLKKDFFTYTNICLFRYQKVSSKFQEKFAKLKQTICNAMHLSLSNAKTLHHDTMILRLLSHKGILYPTHEQCVKFASTRAIHDTNQDHNDDNSFLLAFKKLKNAWQTILVMGSKKNSNFYIQLMINLINSMRIDVLTHQWQTKIIALWLEEIFNQYTQNIDQNSKELSKFHILQMLQELLLASCPYFVNLLIAIMEFLNKRCLIHALNINDVLSIYEKSLNSHKKMLMKKVLKYDSKNLPIV